MILEGTRFGDIEVDWEKIITIPEGILGFPNSKRYVLLDHSGDSPFKWFQSVDEPELTFIIIDPLFFKPDYRIEISRNEIPTLQPFAPDDLSVMAIVTIKEGAKDITANLQGPLVINTKNRLAKQVVLVNTQHTTRHSIKFLFSPKVCNASPHPTLQTV